MGMTVEKIRRREMMSSNQAMVIQINGDKGRLESLESTISKNMKAFYEIGRALKEIRDSRLYKEVLGYETFEDYCRERWDFGRSHSYGLIGSAQVVDNVRHGGQIVPTSERQARPLVKLSPPLQIEAWTKTIKTAPDGRITARHISRVVCELIGKESPRQVSPPAVVPPVVPVTVPVEEPVQDDGYKETLKAMTKAVRAAKRGKYESTLKEAILEDIDALRNMVILTPRTTKRQIELQQFFFQVDEDITKRAAFHVENIKIGDQMRVGDKLTTRGKILKLKGGKVLDVRVVVEKK